MIGIPKGKILDVKGVHFIIGIDGSGSMNKMNIF